MKFFFNYYLCGYSGYNLYCNRWQQSCKFYSETANGSYFNWVQPYQHHTGNPSSGLNVYSFGLTPEEHQPSGTCNMSRIDSAELMLTLTTATGNAKVKVYALSYNVLRIMSGMGGLAYSN